jgi:hypothetical protein
MPQPFRRLNPPPIAAIRIRRLAIVSLLVVLSIATAACKTDYMLRVRNDSETEYYIRVAMDAEPSDRYAVAFVPGDTEGVAVDWDGPRDRPIELLDQECNLIGVFETDDGVNFFVAGVTGLSATIEPFALGQKGSGAIGNVGTCGGWML